MIYKCPRCAKNFKQKSQYTCHMNRKYPCIILSKSIEIPLKIMDIPTPIPIVSPNPLQCEYCNKLFSRSDALKTHTSYHCKIKKKTDMEKEKNENIPQEILKKILEEKIVKMEVEMKIERDLFYIKYLKLEEENAKLKQMLSKKL